MKISRIFAAFLIFLFAGSAAFAQSTTVSGQVTDTAGQSWNNGNITFQFLVNPSYPSVPSYTWTGGALTLTVTGVLNGTGGYSVSVPSNSAITPIGSTWSVKVCPQANPFQCSTTPNIIVTGATQTNNFTPPAFLVNAGPNAVAYGDTEVNGAIGQTYYNLSLAVVRVCQAGPPPCTGNWVTLAAGGSGTIGGSIANTQVAFGSAANTIAGSSNFVYANASGNITATSPSGNEQVNLVPNAGTSFQSWIRGDADGSFRIFTDNANGPNLALSRQFGGFLLGSGTPGQPDVVLNFFGSTGSAQLGINPIAGNPNRMNLPTATGTSGQVLSTNGANPQQLSWINIPGGTLTSTQIAYGSGTNTVTSNSNFTYNASQGGVLGSVCNPTLLDSSGIVDCSFIDAVGTLSSAGTGSGIEGLQGGVSLTMNSPLVYLGDIDGILSNVTTSGTGTFNSTNGLAAFDATATIGSNTWPNFTFYRADKVLSGGGTINNLKAYNAADQSGIATTSAYDYWAAPAVAGGLTAIQYGAGEGVAPSGISAVDAMWADSTAHRWKMNNNNGGALNFAGVATAGTSGDLTQFAANGIDLLDSGISYASSTLGAATTPNLSLTPTWNTTGVVDAGIKLNVTDTASGANSLFVDLLDSGTSEFSIFKNGYINTATGIEINPLQNAAPAGTNGPTSFYSPGMNGGAAGATQTGFKGSSTFWTVGFGSNGGATSGDGGVGGDWVMGGGNGGSATGSGNGGNGGAMHWGAGTGGNGVGTGNGGNGTDIQIPIAGSGNGGNAGVTSGNGGRAGDFIVSPGVGGSSTNGTGGRGGNITLVTGGGGAGVGGTFGTPGEVVISCTGGCMNGASVGPQMIVGSAASTTGAYKAFVVNVSPDTSAAGSKLMALQDGNVDKFDVDKTGYATIFGATSGSASIGVAAVAGTPAQINLPTATGVAGAVLSTDGNTPQQSSWQVLTSLSCAYQGPLAAVVGTGAAATYYTCSVPALAAGTGIAITSSAKHTTGTAAITYTVQFGGSSTTSSGAVTGSANQIEVIKCLLMNNPGSTTAQTVTTTYMDSNAGSNTIKLDTLGVNTGVSNTLNLQFNVAATDQLTPEQFLVQIVK